MLGTIVNTGTILVGSVFGAIVREGIGEKYKKAMIDALGLACLVLGVNASLPNMSKSEFPVLFIFSLGIGGLIGTKLDLAGRVDRASEKRKGAINGLVTGILLYCIGTLSFVGPMMSALYGDNTFLFTNATLDLVTSAVLATTYGIGMVLAAPVLFCWQGAFYLAAKLAGGVIPDAMVTEISIVGGTLIAASGLSILQIKDCKTLNLLPSLAVPILFFLLKSLF